MLDGKLDSQSIPGELTGGAILPGIQLQFRALSSGTAALPRVPVQDLEGQRWARSTQEAIKSGVANSVRAAVRDFVTAFWEVNDWLKPCIRVVETLHSSG